MSGNNTSNGSRPVHGRGLVYRLWRLAVDRPPPPPAPDDDTEPAVMALGGDRGDELRARRVPAVEAVAPGGDLDTEPAVMASGDRGDLWTRDLERLVDHPRPLLIPPEHI